MKNDPELSDKFEEVIKSMKAFDNCLYVPSLEIGEVQYIKGTLIDFKKCLEERSQTSKTTSDKREVMRRIQTSEEQMSANNAPDETSSRSTTSSDTKGYPVTPQDRMRLNLKYVTMHPLLRAFTQKIAAIMEYCDTFKNALEQRAITDGTITRTKNTGRKTRLAAAKKKFDNAKKETQSREKECCRTHGG